MAFAAPTMHSSSIQCYGVPKLHLALGCRWLLLLLLMHVQCITFAAGCAGPSAVLQLLPNGKLKVAHLPDEGAEQQVDDGSWKKPEWGQYRERGTVAGLPIMVRACGNNVGIQRSSAPLCNSDACCSILPAMLLTPLCAAHAG